MRSQRLENSLPRKGVARQALGFVFHSRSPLQILKRLVPSGKWGRKRLCCMAFADFPCIAVLPGNSKLQRISSDTGKMN